MAKKQTKIIQKPVTLYPTQYEFFAEPGFTAFIGGIGSGKTYVGAMKAIDHAAKGTLGMVVAPTYTMLRDSTLRTFMELAGNFVIDFNKTDMVATVQTGGEILFRSADKPDRNRGPNLHYAWIDEGSLTPPGTWEVSVGSERAGGQLGDVWVTGTPKGKNHWTYKLSDQMTVFRATTFDNPYASEEWKQALAKGYSGNFRRQELYAEFVSFEGLVYPMFDRAIHIREYSHRQFDSYELTVDEGYTNPAVILKVYERNGGEHFHIASEWYETGKLHSQIVKAAEGMADPGCEVVVDAAAAGLRAEFRDAGFYVRSGKGRVLDGINKVGELLDPKNGGPRLTIDPGCVRTINEFESYTWKDDKDEPVKEFDHAMDAIRYKVMSQPRVREAKQSRW